MMTVLEWINFHSLCFCIHFFTLSLFYLLIFFASITFLSGLFVYLNGKKILKESEEREREQTNWLVSRKRVRNKLRLSVQYISAKVETSISVIVLIRGGGKGWENWCSNVNNNHHANITGMNYKLWKNFNI